MVTSTSREKQFLEKCAQLDARATKVFLYQGAQATQLSTALPFHVTTDPMYISAESWKSLEDFGRALAQYYQAFAKIRGEKPKYIFLRPDILLTEHGFKVCEVETSPFGFSLSLFLSENISVPSGQQIGSSQKAIQLFCKRWREYSGKNSGTFVYTDHSRLFTGQLTYLSEACQRQGLDMSVKHVQEAQRLIRNAPMYRCFYWYERSRDYRVSQFCQTHSQLIPSGNDIYEGKHMLALWQNPFVRELLPAPDQEVISNFFLPTWVITNQVPTDFPLSISEWSEIAELPKSKRYFVVKRVGNHPDASWSRSVVFLHKRTKKEVQYALQRAMLEPGEWVIQQFIGNDKYTIRHANRTLSAVEEMKGRIRITPYYDFQTGELLVAKVTVRRDTLFIHGATDSVNTVLAKREE